MPTTREFTLYLYFVEKNSTPDEPCFYLSDTEGMAGQGWTFVREVTVTQELPAMKDLQQQRLALLDAMKAEARAKFARTMKEIDDRINSLLAIENSAA